MGNENVVTMGIFAHANAGKTTITENLLYYTNVIDEVGRVDNGNTITDSMNIEKKRGIIQTKIIPRHYQFFFGRSVYAYPGNAGLRIFA